MALIETILGAVAGDVISGIFGKEQADTNRSWQQEMSNTAYQRAMKDMKKAGLNPILAGKLGGASTPHGNIATMPSLGGSITGALNANAAQRQAGTAEDLAEENIKKIQQEIQNYKETEHLTQIQKAHVSAQINEVQQRVSLMMEQTDAQHYDNVQSRIVAEFYESAEAARIAKEIGITPSVFKQIFMKFFGRDKGK
jgi:hypothetical protein